MVTKPQRSAGFSLEEFTSRFKEADLNTFFIFGAIILILIVGGYALFSADSRNAAKGNPACGKIVIAADGFSLASNVSATLSDARYFLVVDPLTRKLVDSIKNPYRGQQDTQLVYLIAGKGEEAVIVGSIDQQSYEILGQFGIRVFGGYQGRAQKVVRLYREARISATPQPMGNNGQAIPMAQQVRGLGQGMNAQGAGMGMYQPCPMPVRAMGNGVGMGLGMQAMQGAGVGAPCPLPNRVMGNGMGMGYGMQVMQPPAVNNYPAANQVGLFGWGQQAFVCPTCNWRMKASRQGNNFPRCPNCGGSMALDMQNQNNEATIMPEGMWAANNTPVMVPQYNQGAAQYNQMYAQQNLPQQGAELTGAFLCPNCNWRMYSQQGANEFPQCPNCGQIMARSGNSAQLSNNGQGAFAQVAAVTQQPAAGNAPPIPADAQMAHSYRGVCTNCHQILNSTPVVQAQNLANPAQDRARMAIGGGK